MVSRPSSAGRFSRATRPARRRLDSLPSAEGLGLPFSEYLKTLAVSRLFLDNFANLQASWVTQGLAVGQLAMRFGANDFGSLMIEENVVAAAGTIFGRPRPKSAESSRDAGYPPRKRDVFYEIFEEIPEAARLI